MRCDKTLRVEWSSRFVDYSSDISIMAFSTISLHNRVRKKKNIIILWRSISNYTSKQCRSSLFLNQYNVAIFLSVGVDCIITRVQLVNEVTSYSTANSTRSCSVVNVLSVCCYVWCHLRMTHLLIAGSSRCLSLLNDNRCLSLCRTRRGE